MAKHPLVATPKLIQWAGGHDEKLTALERPQLLFENGQPIALLCASASDKNRDGTFNIQIPLKAAE